MEERSDPSSLVELESDIDSMVATLESETPSAPEIHNMVKEESLVQEKSYKITLKGREAVLSGIDDLLISRGARLILVLPIIVVFLFQIRYTCSLLLSWLLTFFFC